MTATITDVARLAGVSMKTVSRVLNNEPNVTAKTRERVQAAAAELRYRPNLSARGLASSRKYLLALLYDNPSAEYVGAIQAGATEACRKRGFHLVVEPIRVPHGEINSELEVLLQRLPVDGVILTPPLSDIKALMDVLDDVKIPYVPIAPSETTKANVPSIGMDDTAAAKEMTQYLMSIGHRDIGFIIGPPDHSASALRKNGFLHAMSDAGLDVPKNRMLQGDFSFESGKACAQKLLSGPNIPTAIFASNDDMAAAVLSVAGKKGIPVPQKLSVAGFDDTALARVIWPPLTTIRQPIHDMGSRAARMLINGVTKTTEDIPPLMLEHNIIVRASTAPPAQKAS